MGIDLSRLRRGNDHDRRPWHGAAFIVEALVLLVFLIASLAVIMQVIAGAHERSIEADRLSNAIILASNDAEAFAADPTSGNTEESTSSSTASWYNPRGRSTSSTRACTT